MYALLLQLIATCTAEFYLPLVYIRDVISLFHPKQTRIAVLTMWTLYTSMVVSLTVLIIWMVEEALKE
jgi:hypothetical protein